MNFKNHYHLEIWIGLAKIKGKFNNSSSNVENGYVNVLALSNDKKDFRKKVNSHLENQGLTLVRLEDPEPLDLRTKKYHVDKSLLKLASKISSNLSIVEISTIHTYD